MRKGILGHYLLATLSLVLSVVHAQGPAPSPLISAPSSPPPNVPAIQPQLNPAPAPELTKADFETFLDGRIRGDVEKSLRGARKRHETVAHLSREPNASAHFSAGQSSFLFQLWIYSRWIHRRACQRRKIRAVHHQSYFTAVANDEFDVRSTAASATRGTNVKSLSYRLQEAAGFRIRPGCARRRAFNHRRRHDALHACISSRRQRGRSRNLETRNCSRDANAPVCDSSNDLRAGHYFHGILPGPYTRHRSWRRH